MKTLISSLSLFFFLGLLWSQEAFLYLDCLVIEEQVTQATSLIFPAKAVEKETIPAVSLISESITNIYPESLLPILNEYIKLTNTLASLSSQLTALEQKQNRLVEKRKLLMNILENLAQNQSTKSADLMDKYERQLTTTEESLLAVQSEILPLRTRLTTFQEQSKQLAGILASRSITLVVWNLEQPFTGTLRYVLPAQWRIRYTLSVEKETLGADVLIQTAFPIEKKLPSLWIIGYPYQSKQRDMVLPRLKLYLQRNTPLYKSSPAPARAMTLPEAYEEDKSIPIQETPASQGSVWFISNTVFLRQNTTIPLWEPKKIGLSSSYFVLAPKSTWGWYRITLSNTLPLSLIPGEVVVINQGKTSPLFLPQTIVPSTSFSFPGVEVRNIEVKRELVKDYKDMPGILRSTILHEKQWKITIRNHLNKTIRLTVLDRIPIPSEDRIVIKNITISEKSPQEIRSIQTNDGIITWNIELRAGEEKSLSVGYTLEYPKDTDYYEQEE